MPLGLYPRETAEALEPGVGETGTSAPPTPSFFQGAGKATALGVGEGAIKAGSLVGDTNIGGALAPMGTDYQPPLEEMTPAEHQAHLDQTTAQAVAAFAPDPHTTGTAGEILHGVASGLTRFVAGNIAGGPLTGAATVGLTEGETQAAQLRAQGVDADTAKLAGLGQGLMSGVGAGMPGGAGAKLLTRVVTGASMQTTAGMVNRGMMHSVLADAGYTYMAEQYKPLDGMSVITDAVLGSAFGGVHHVFAPSVVDAAHTAADAVHVEDAAPGAPITPESRQNHTDNMTAAAEALLSGKDMPDLKPVETIPNPAQDALRSTNVDAVREAAQEITEPSNGLGFDSVVRYGPSDEVMSPDKYQGLYTTPSNVESPHADLGERHEFNVNPEANVLSLDAGSKPDIGMRKGLGGDYVSTAGTGIHALQQFLGNDEFQKIRHLNFDQMMDYAKQKFPDADWSVYDKSRGQDAQDIAEGVAGLMARQRGYDAIYGRDKGMPGFSEYVALTKKAFRDKPAERRADEVEAGRMRELNAKRGKLTDAEKDELIELQDRDRLAAKVGGRRMQGVLNDDAYAEMLQRGEAKPVQGFIDMDMLKSLNDQHGHAVGDDAIRTLGETLGNYFGQGNVFRRSSGGAGDEFIVQSADDASHQASVDSARQYLGNHTLRATDAAGNIIAEKRGIGFSHGSGPDIESAERAQYADKAERARLGLRNERRPVDAESAETRGENKGSAATGSKTGSVTTHGQAVSALSKALATLRDSEGTDEASHAQVRSIVQDVQAKGMDAASIERAAVERAGQGANEALGGAKENENARNDTGALDPQTKEAVDAVEGLFKSDPEIGKNVVFNTQTGEMMSARDMLRNAIRDAGTAKDDGMLHQVAAACFGRVG